MQIQAINNFSNTKIQKPQFKSAYPVYHWVAEKGGGSSAPAVTHELNKKLQGVLVRLMNKTSKLSETGFGQRMIEKLKLDNLTGVGDFDYSLKSVVRTFNNKNGGWKGEFVPINYLISGNDVKLFDESFGKPIGRTYIEAPRVKGMPSSAEYRSAVRDYVLGGLNFVKNPKRKIIDRTGMEYGLHTKFEVVRNKNGEIKGYELVDIKFCPERGKENPFVKLGYYGSKLI